MVISGVLVSFGGAAAAAQPADCKKVELVTFRGSGEGKADDGDKSNGYSGPTLQAIIDAARKRTSPTGFTLDGVPVYGVPYPAVPFEEFFSKEQDLWDSMEYGRLFGLGYINKRHTECKDAGTHFVLVGYSQGALVARQVAEDLPADLVGGVFAIGDPAQKAGAPGVTGSGASGNGSYRLLIEKDGIAGTDAFYDLGLPSYLFCHQGDDVCDTTLASWPPFSLAPHLNYGKTTTERNALADELSALAEQATSGTPAPPVRNPADVMFAIDTTGSMSPYLAAAVASAARTADTLRTTASVARVGLVEYRDFGDAQVAGTVVPLTTDLSQFDTGLASLFAAGGGDTPEAVYTGLVTALRADWNAGATRALIVLGDAPAHDPEPFTGLTAATVADIAHGIVALPALPPTIGAEARFESANPSDAPVAPDQEPAPSQDRADALDTSVSGQAVAPALAPGELVPPVAVYGLSADSGLSTQLDTIADATGGLVLPIDSPDELTDSLVRSIEDASTAPVAQLTGPDTAIVGAGTVLSALRSTFSGDTASYAFDFDGDRTIDETNTDGIARHIYPTVGTVTPTVTITDSRGRSATAELELQIRPVESLNTGSTTTPPPPPTTQPQPAPQAPPQGIAYTGVPDLRLTFLIGALAVLTGTFTVAAARCRRRPTVLDTQTRP